MGLSIEKVVAFDPARLVNQNAQSFSGAIQTVVQQRRKSGIQRVMFYALCHAINSFVKIGKNASYSQFEMNSEVFRAKTGSQYLENGELYVQRISSKRF